MIQPNFESIVIKPRILPRDLVDICLGLPIGIFGTALFVVLPAVLVFFFCARALGAAEIFSVMAAFATYFLISGYLFLFVVRRLTVTTDGLHFHRVLGTPKFLAWEQISSVATAPRRELVICGWLWPLFPSRAMAPSLSALKQYRITWDAGFCYYPPADLETFGQHVVGRLRLLREAGPGGNKAICAQCGGIFNIEETISHGDYRVCARCKPVFFQRLVEGDIKGPPSSGKS